ncbi:hypothetical protein XPR_0052, partial [Xanthomonas arboricola pv. pruni MAFF 301420]
GLCAGAGRAERCGRYRAFAGGRRAPRRLRARHGLRRAARHPGRAEFRSVAGRRRAGDHRRRCGGGAGDAADLAGAQTGGGAVLGDCAGSGAGRPGALCRAAGRADPVRRQRRPGCAALGRSV